MKIEVDKTVWNKMKQRLLKDNAELRIGFFESDNYGPENDSLPVAQVAKWNDQGSETNPPRAFLSGEGGFIGSARRGMYNAYFVESIQRIAEGKSTFTQEYRKLGPMMKKDLQEVIEDWSTPPNSPVTIERKGFNNPLVDSGTMHDSVGWMVAPSGTKEGGD